MAPMRPKKRHSDQPTTAPATRHGETAVSQVPLKGDSPATPHRISKQRRGISAQQKQSLIDNLQLEVTERARRLRAQYCLQAQGLRSRIEIRINRIPTSLRKTKMGDLVLKYLELEQKRIADGRPTSAPAKGTPSSSPQKAADGAAHSQAPRRAYKGLSDELSGGKENGVEDMDGKRRARGAQATDAGPVRPAQVLSPTSSNSRLARRDRPPSPTKSQIARPGSPLKSSGTSRSAAVTSVLSSMVERAKATRHGGTRKVTATSEASTSSMATTTATRGKRPAASKAPVSRPATRAGRRASGISEASEASTGTVIRKTGTSRAAAAAATTKKKTMGAIRKGVAGGGAKKTAARPAAAPASTNTSGRVLRKRG